MIGSFGNVVFEVSPEKIRTFRDFQIQRSAKYSEHAIHGRKGLLEFTGFSAATASLRIRLDAGLGVNPDEELKSEAGDHTAKTLTNLANIMAAHEEQIGRAIKIDQGRTENYCRTVDPSFLARVNAIKPETMENLADIWYGENQCGRNQHYHTSRYHMLNLHACFTKGTIEFRLFQFDEPHDCKKGGIHCGQLKAYIQLCLAMSQLAKNLTRASNKPQQRENERYAFRCWMLRLGFIGEEFKTARTLLLRNVSVNGAWRS